MLMKMVPSHVVSKFMELLLQHSITLETTGRYAFEHPNRTIADLVEQCTLILSILLTNGVMQLKWW